MKTPSALGLAAGGLAVIAMLLFSGQYSTPLAESGTQLFLSKVLEGDEQAYIEWLGKFGRSYATKEEYMFRLEQFKRTWKEIAVHDEEYHGFKVGLNAFSDITEDEWQRKLKGLKVPPENLTLEHEGKVPAEYQEQLKWMPEAVDWRKDGAVTPIKDMKDCDASWAFSAVGAIEGAYAIRFGILQDFSEQQIIDCVRNQYCNGCDGGMPIQVFEWLRINRQGIVQTTRYPYTAKQGECQQFDRRIDQGFIFSYLTVDPTQQLLQSRLVHTTVSIGISVNSKFKNYESGIITKDCNGTPNFAATAVGYGKDPSGQEYIIVKNSWGTTWGEDGYARIAPDQCAMTSMAVSPIMGSY